MIGWFPARRQPSMRHQLPLASAALVVAVVAVVSATGVAPPRAAPVFPASTWEAEPAPPSPDAVRRRDELTALLRQGDTSAMLVVVGGRVRFSYGDVAEASYLAS